MLNEALNSSEKKSSTHSKKKYMELYLFLYGIIKLTLRNSDICCNIPMRTSSKSLMNREKTGSKSLDVISGPSITAN